ncbi:MAG: hypothetical protein Fur0037_20520 [Planctomycetota bacterium]
MPICFFLSVLPALATQSPDPQGPLPVEIFDLRALRWEAPASPPPPIAHLLDRSGMRSSLLDEDLSPSFRAEKAADWLGNLNKEALEQGRGQLRAEGTWLVMQADSSLLPQLKEQLEALTAILTRPIEIEACLYEAPASGTWPPVLTAGAFAERTRGHDPLWRSTSRTRYAGRVELGRENWTSYVRSVYAEVAQNTKSVAPAIGRFFSGVRVSALPFALAGSEDVVLHAQFAVAEPREVLSRPTGFPGQANLETPVLEYAVGAMSGRVPPGGALAVTFTGSPTSGKRCVLTLRAILPAPRPPFRVGKCMLFPIGALTSNGLAKSRRVPWKDSDEDDLVQESEDEEVQPGISLAELESLLQSAAGSENAEVSMGRLWARVAGSEPALQRAQKAIVAIEDRLPRNEDLALRLVPLAAPSAGLLPGRAGNPLHEFRTPSLPGRTVCFQRGVAMTAPIEIAVELAQDSAIQIPSVISRSTGAFGSAVAAETPQGRHLRLFASFASEVESVRRVLESGGVLVLPRPDIVDASWDGLAKGEADVDLGEGPRCRVDGRTCGSAISFRLGGG